MLCLGAVLGLAAAAAYLAILAWSVTQAFEQRRWEVPAQVYAAPLEIYPGRPLGNAELVAELRRLGYRAGAPLEIPGTFAQRGDRFQIHSRGFESAEGSEPARRLRIDLARGRVATLELDTGTELDLIRLEPLLIGSLFPAHGEDRLALGPAQTPALLTEALQAVEDRRFAQHRGIDLRAVARAAWVNLRHGEIRQGASTLTQQLVRSYFLHNGRDWTRKFQEAAMAVALEWRYDKAELMQAYVNEVYLGQDGARAVHGFGLASQFYFGKPASELELDEIAVLVGLVRGPAYYDPRLHPDRARQRRNLVLDQMYEVGLISDTLRQQAAAAPLRVLAAADEQTGHYAAFLDLVRRQIGDDYPEDVLTRKGLRIFTTLSPITQAATERAVVNGIAKLQRDRSEVELEAAVLVSQPSSGEVLAVVGSREPGFDGFNRALNARRPIGSLVKPMVYLAALQSQRYSLASLIDDAPLAVPLPNGDIWSPTNFDGEAHGPVPLVRALAESLNLATVRLGLDIGVDTVAELMSELGLDRKPPAYPSLLLGAVDLTPIEVASLYNTLANAGFRVPLRAVRAVLAQDGAVDRRYPLALATAADAASVHQLNQGLVQAMSRGTGRRAAQALPAGLTVAGKTGTSDGLRDSWFAGFGGDLLAVVWIGADDNAPTGLTGATGAALVWADLMATMQPRPFSPPTLSALPPTWIDYETGLLTAPRCSEAIELPLPAALRPPRASSCGGPARGERLRQWFQGLSR